MEKPKLHTDCCIAGGGPAGMMLGYLLARAGVEVMVLEKHADFFRDFRGDTIHPSTLEVLHELGILEDFLKLPHQKAETIGGEIGNFSFTAADFRHLPTQCKFIALAPQWDFLNFIASQAKRHPLFHLKMEHEVTDLVRDGKRIVGVHATTPQGPVEVRADLVVAADGRSSKLREQSGLKIKDLGAPFDVLWLRLSRKETDPNQSLGQFGAGHALVMINRSDYWQCGYLIEKGHFDRIKDKGMAAFQRGIVELVPVLQDRVGELTGWDKVKLLTVQVNRLQRWHLPGFLCIGDAAHAMSPVGGVGINLAIQDAVAASNILAGPLRDETADEDTLAHVQMRREWPTQATQAAQVFIQNKFLFKILSARGPLQPPLVARLLNTFPLLRRIPAHLIGLGVRPEHVETQEVKSGG